jgi:hypothetical protein
MTKPPDQPDSNLDGLKPKRHIVERMPRRLVKARQALILGLYASGRTVEQIAARLGSKAQHVTRDLNIALDQMVKHYALPSPAHNFVRYAAFQFGIIHKLQDACELFTADPDSKQYNAMVSALRAQSDIYDKIIDKGITFGVISKSKADPDRIRQSPATLRVELREKIQTLEILLDEVDEHAELRSQRKQLQLQQSLPLPTGDTRSRSGYAARIRKVQRDSYGIVRLLPDWKYKRELYDSDGNRIPIYARTEQDKANLVPDPRDQVTQQLHTELANERHKRQLIKEDQDHHQQQPEPTPDKESHPPVIDMEQSEDGDHWLVPPQRE